MALNYKETQLEYWKSRYNSFKIWKVKKIGFLMLLCINIKNNVNKNVGNFV
jgi:hypothetical protein